MCRLTMLESSPLPREAHHQVRLFNRMGREKLRVSGDVITWRSADKLHAHREAPGPAAGDRRRPKATQRAESVGIPSPLVSGGRGAARPPPEAAWLAAPRPFTRKAKAESRYSD